MIHSSVASSSQLSIGRGRVDELHLEEDRLSGCNDANAMTASSSLDVTTTGSASVS